MKPDLSLQDELRKLIGDKGLCTAIERNGDICFRKIDVKNKKLCNKHYLRLFRLKSINLPIKEKNKCKFIDCDSKITALGYCNKHYRRIKLIKKIEQCIVDGCFNKVDSKNLCSKHRTRLRRHKDFNVNLSNLRSKGANKGKIAHNKGKFKFKECIVPSCNIKNREPHALVRGLCRMHYCRWKKYGDYNIKSKKEYQNAITKRKEGQD